MAKSVDQIRAQIAKLQEREKALLQKEAVGVVARIKEAVAHYGITPEQIFGSNDDAMPAGKRVVTRKVAAQKVPGARKNAAKAPKAKTVRAGRAQQAEGASEDASSSRGPSPAKGIKVAPKFSDGAGNSWSGRGSQPRWLRAAIEGGKSLQDFAVA